MTSFDEYEWAWIISLLWAIERHFGADVLNSYTPEGGTSQGLLVIFWLFEGCGLFTQILKPGKNLSQGATWGSPKWDSLNFNCGQYMNHADIFFKIKFEIFSNTVKLGICSSYTSFFYLKNTMIMTFFIIVLLMKNIMRIFYSSAVPGVHF